jgi:hypothetical protein
MAMYQKVVALNKETHRSHKLKPISDLSFTADMQTIPLVPTEFVEAAKEYPIVFVKPSPTGNEMQPMLLLGLKNGENLYAKKDGTWDARYIPAFIRRYPFIFATAGNEQYTLCVDSDYPGFSEGEGTPLFDGNEESAFLKELLSFVTNYHRDAQMTPQFVAKLQALDLLEERNLKAEMKDGREFTVRGFYVVNEAKLVKLDAAQAHELFTTGALALVYAHLISLSNMNRLVDMEANKTRES